MSNENYDGVTQCQGTNRKGEQCEVDLGPGKRYCHWHGGASPNEQKNVQERLLQIADDGTAELYEMLNDPSVSDNVKVKIVQDALDRAGPAKTKKKELTGEDGEAIEMDIDGDDLSPSLIDDLSELFDGD